jgi:hypothetical protein
MSIAKETYWSNGWPSSSTFTIKSYTDEQGNQWSTRQLLEENPEGHWPGQLDVEVG